MTGNDRYDKARALFLALVMVISVFGMTVAFAGGAAATVQDVNGLAADDVTPGPDQVTQSVTIQNVENDNSSGTINITNNVDALDDTVINESQTSVTSTNHGSSGASVRTVTSDGTIVVDLPAESGTTADITLDVVHDTKNLTQTEVDSLPIDVTYTATSETNSVSVSDTFTITEKQPEFTNGSATIPTSAPNTMEVTFDEPIEVNGDVGAEFSLTNVTDATGSALTVTGYEAVSGNTITLTLSGYVASNATYLEVSYAGGSDDPIVHANDDTVVAHDSSDKEVTNSAQPALVNAKVTDTNPDRLVMDFSEPLDSGSNSAIASAFSLSDSRADIKDVYENTSTSPDDQVILNLTTSIAPGADLTGLSYDGSTALNSSLPGSNDAPLYAFSGATVTNDVVPVLQSAEVTDANKSVIIASYQDGAEVELNSQSNFAGGTNTNLNIVDSSDASSFGGVSLGPNEVALLNETAFAAANGSSLNLQDSGSAVNSTSDVKSTSSEVQINNNVTPTVVSAKVTNANPDQLQITFSENVQKNISTGGNIDSAVTDAFSFEDQEGDKFRIRNVSNIGTNTITLNLGQPDGTPDKVKVGDDLTDALSYDPTAPSDSAENYPLNASAGTNANVKAFQNQDVTNNVDVDFDVAEVTTNGDQIRVTFTNDVEQVGTLSEIENAFEVGSDVISVDSTGSYIGIENGDTVVFDRTVGEFVVDGQESNYNSSTDLTGTNGLNYTAADGGSPLEIAVTDEPVSDFSEKDITNNIQPRIDSAEVTNANPGKIQVTYTENITGSDGEAYKAFSLDGADAPAIDGQSTSEKTLNLTLAEDVEKNDELGVLTYSGGTSDEEVISGTGSDAVGVDGDSVDVTISVGTNPVLEHVTVDDAAENDDGDAKGEILLKFDSAVSVDGTDATGLSFNGDDTAYNVSISSLNNTESASPDDVVVATIDSESGSDSSMIQSHNDLSAASVTVTDASAVAISGADKGNPIAENKVTDVRNEIAGDLANVDSTEIDVELIGTEVDTKGSFNVTVSGFEDADDTKVIDETITIQVGSKTYQVSTPRFNESVTIEESNPVANIDKANVEVGSEVVVDVKGVEVASTENVTYVHEAFTQNKGWELTSQPMPGEFVAGDKITDVTYYDADAAEDESEFGSYDKGNQVQMVHNALFVNAESDNAEYGFAYDEDRSGQQTNVGDISMGEGWHIVGSNYDISQAGGISLDADLATENAPESAVVDVQLKSLPGTTLNNDATVEDHGVYYVYLHQQDDRAIVLPAYSTSTYVSGDQVTP